MPPSCSPVFQYNYSHFSVFCIHFTKSSIYDVCTEFPPIFSILSCSIKFYDQNSVKILTNPYSTWRHCLSKGMQDVEDELQNNVTCTCNLHVLDYSGKVYWCKFPYIIWPSTIFVYYIEMPDHTHACSSPL